MADPISKVSVAPAQGTQDLLGIGVEQQLVGVESEALQRVIRSVDPVAIEQTRTGFRQIAMPDLVGVLRKHHPMSLLASILVEKAQLDLFRILGENGEIHPFSVPGRALRIGSAWPDCGLRLHEHRAVYGAFRRRHVCLV